MIDSFQWIKQLSSFLALSCPLVLLCADSHSGIPLRPLTLSRALSHSIALAHTKLISLAVSCALSRSQALSQALSHSPACALKISSG